ncbi:MAG: type I-U CRISPR-associated RAMP protein Csb1/Cas7u [Acidobacteria bacterium]|nr:type I-U CRISPR-associated RAMP protein Csb1/Cas7u [Acidobacteriota bacterium]
MQPENLLMKLNQAGQSGKTAIRVITRLVPAGGESDKVFPPTYAGEGKTASPRYHREKRLIGGQEIDVVVLDSVQSQANRLEEALLKAFNANQCNIPVVCVDITNHGRITALDAPHRISDAIFRDSLYRDQRAEQAVPFRESEIGRRIVRARVNNATAFFEFCPTALIFGTWDSHGGEGVRSAKVQRALTSEIVGLKAVPGDRSSSRIDPIGIQKEAAKIYQHSTDHWTMDPTKAVLDEKGNPKLFGKEGTGKGKPSEIGHGNVRPGIDKDLGGVTISEAVQTTVLSFVQLRRLRFPNQDGNSSPERDTAGRTVLAALALYAITLQMEEGYDLRSRCLLQPKDAPQFELLGPIASNTEPFTLTKDEAKTVFEKAREKAVEIGLNWRAGLIELTPSAKLQELVSLSDRLIEEPED